MKKFLATIFIMTVFSSIASGQQATLSPTVDLSVPTATKIEIRKMLIEPGLQRFIVTYRWLDAAGDAIAIAGTHGITNRTWACQGSCFTDIFGFSIRAQDVGTSIGKGLRALLINEMKNSISELSGITITFSD